MENDKHNWMNHILNFIKIDFLMTNETLKLM